MHGNTPHAGTPRVELDAEGRRALRRSLTTVQADTRALLPDEFAVGTELVEGDEGPRATVAVRPPVGSVVSANVPIDGDSEGLASQLAAAAALEVKHSLGARPHGAC
jgi:hypothetical protein